jgi:hypothetical protein
MASNYLQSVSIDDYEEEDIPIKKTVPDIPTRVFSGTYNVRGRPNINENGILEKILPEDVLPWVKGIDRGLYS